MVGPLLFLYIKERVLNEQFDTSNECVSFMHAVTLLD
jgi:hypothetical protein